MNSQKIFDTIRKYQDFIISAHIQPEGDAIGSQLALARLLTKLGKNVRIVNADPVPQPLRFMPGSQEIITTREKVGPAPAAAVILDCPSLERIGWVKDMLGKAVLINVDHHISNNKFGAENWVDPQAASAGEMVFKLFQEAGVAIDEETAICLYTAIMTDTGSFRFSNTTPQTHQIAAELLRFPIKPEQIYEKIYEVRSLAEMELLGAVLNTLEQVCDSRAVMGHVTLEQFKQYGLGAESTDHFIDVIRMVDGSEVVAFLRELENKEGIKVSLRSKGRVDVNKLAHHFGGGGHPAASGCRIKADMTTARRQLGEKICRALSGE